MFSGIKKLFSGKSKENTKEDKSTESLNPTGVGQTIGMPTLHRSSKMIHKKNALENNKVTTNKIIEEQKDNTLDSKTNSVKEKTTVNTATNSSKRLVVPKLKSEIEENKKLKEDDIKKESFNKKNELSQLLENSISVKSATPKEEEIATIFSEGHDQQALDIIKAYFKEKSGKVEARVWYMLLDIYQIQGAVNEFDKTSLAFAQAFGTSPPSWFGPKNNTEEKENIGNGKNMIIFSAVMKNDFTDKFKELFKAAKQEKFCRINISQCKFEQNEIELFDKFLKLLKDLRKAKIPSVLMGDNNLLIFCQKFLQDEKFRKNLSSNLLNNEHIIWQLYLEILQWKGNNEEFDNIALDYANKFEVSPPGWEDSGVMNINQSQQKEKDTKFVQVFEKDLNGQNINKILEKISKDFEQKHFSELDFSLINRIDFNAAGSITYHIHELWANPNNSEKKVILKYPNELITVLLQMLGVTEVLSIIPRNRK